MAYIQRSLSLAAIRAQCRSLLGKLEGMGRGTNVTLGRRKEALELERRCVKERKATAVILQQGFNIQRRGFEMGR